MMVEPPWSQYDQAYKRIHDRLVEILAKLSSVNVNTPPGESNYIFDGGVAAPSAAGELTILTVTPSNGETRYVTEVIGGGNVKGYVTIYWGSTVKWRGRFLADASVGQQFKTPIKVVGDGATQLTLKVYAAATGNVEAFLGMTW
ncbi:MAG: hypothetical protein QXU38_02220 [Candidatus Bathyarchaeia archaeon]